MYVCSIIDGNLLGDRGSPASGNFDATSCIVPYNGDFRVGENVSVLHERHKYDVHRRSHDRSRLTTFQFTQKSGAENHTDCWVFSSKVQ